MAVYTKLSKDQIAFILSHFKLPAFQSFQSRGIATGTVNTYYKITLNTGPVIYLKIDEVGNLPRLKNELNVFAWLNKNKNKLTFVTPQPLSTFKNKFYIPYKDKYALIITEVPGSEIDPLGPKHLKSAGKALAQLHKIKPSKQLKAHRFNLAGLIKTFKTIQGPLVKKHPQICQDLKERLQRLKKNEPKNLKQVVVHADLFPENIIWQKSKLSGLIDFEAAGLDSALFDVCVCLHALGFHKQKYNPSHFKCFLDGYEELRPLNQSEIKNFDFYLELTTLRFLITRLKDFELTGASKSAKNFKNYKEYVKRLDQIQTIQLKK